MRAPRPCAHDARPPSQAVRPYESRIESVLWCNLSSMQRGDGRADRSWGDGIRRGDAAAFRRIYTEVVPRMLTVAYGYVGSRVEAEEVVQDVVLSLWENHEHFDATGNLVHYLLRAARNRALNAVERERSAARAMERLTVEREEESWSAPADLPELSEGGDEGDGLPAGAFTEAYDAAVAALPERCREVYLLSRSANLSYAEIARMMGISVHTVNAHMGRALRLLRGALRGWRPEGE